MSNKLKLVNLLSDTAESSTSGQLEITRNSVVWKLVFLQGKLESATHSLQSGRTIKYYLRSIGYDDIAKIDLLSDKNPNLNSPLVKDTTYLLESRGYINSKQKAELIKKLTEDALEPLLWLSEIKEELTNKYQIKHLSIVEKQTIAQHELLEIQPLLKNIGQRLQVWQKLNPLIVSPHQRPYCVNPSLLEKSTSFGTLSLAVLKQLVGLMRGLSIRELAFFVRQDELKFAQILSSYIKHEVLQLHPPKSPLDLLPQIPPLSLTKDPPPNQATTNPTNITTIPTDQKKYTIACIDDSPSMLSIIESYLATDKYNLITIEEPMKALNNLFKSNPDLILMDISMPGMNGNRFCQILKSSSVFKSVPIILISGNTKILNQETLKSTGAVDFLAKPFSKETLLQMIHKYC